MKYLIAAGATALITLASLQNSSAQIITFYDTEVGPTATSVDFTKIYDITAVTDPEVLEGSFTGSLENLSAGQTPVDSSLTETITLESSTNASPPIEVAVYDSGPLAASSIADPDSFHTGSTLDTTYFGTYDEVVFDVTGSLDFGGELNFQGALDLSDVPEPSVSALLLAGFGGLALVIRRRRSQSNS